MQQSWHDINDPGFFKPKDNAAKTARPVERDADTPERAPEQEPEVNLISATWEKGAEGYQFNKKAGVIITSEFLKETPRRKISCGLFVVYDGQEEDLNHQVDAELEDDGSASAEVTLYYGNGYYNALPENPEATCQYKVKVTHPRGTAELESEPLAMPQTMGVDFIEIADVHFHHNCALPCLDEKGELIARLAQVFVFAKDNPGRELIVEGHADRSGDDTYNLQISKRRAEGIKALLANDVSLWEGVINADGTDHKLETEDYQQTLKGLAAKYKWSCDPGSVDNKPGPKTENAVTGFQTEFNRQFPSHEQLTIDGKFGPKSWKAKFFVLRNLLEKALKSKLLDPIPTLTWGYPDGNGIYPCGESCPVTDLEKSEEDRRVELVFYKQGDAVPAIAPSAGRKIEGKKDPVTEKKWEKTPIDPGAAQQNGKVPQVKIDTLDKWFIPGPRDKGGETCTLNYSLGVCDGFAGAVSFEVFASNYCKAEMKDDYSVAFSLLADPVPVYSQRMPPEKSEANKKHEITDWNGKSTAADGALKPREGQERFINAAFSPYTVHFRCHIDDADKEARIDLLDFWPRWNKDSGAIENESLKIRWKVLKTAKFKQGRLIIVDKTDSEIFAKDLADADLKEGDHEFAWDGTLSAGGQMAKENMPYRVQLQAWSAEEEAQGVSAAAMHTEVRLFVHPDTEKHPDEPWKDPNSLKFALAPHVTAEPQEADGERWYQWKLAEAGFHPGPVDGTLGDTGKTALIEFQRSYPSNTAAPFQRLTPDGSMNAQTKDALKRLAVDARPMFGDPDAHYANLSREDAAKRINDKDKSAIVWVDDRHFYTDGKADAMFLNNYHGGMSIGDGIVGMDKKAIARPWIPLMVDIPLLSKTKGLNDGEGIINDATRAAVGPCRLDWAFDEIGQDLAVIDTAHADYDKTRTRSRKWIEEVVKSEGVTAGTKTYLNCPEKSGAADCGGCRPQDISKYYKAVFGLENESLAPWRTIDDAANKTVYSLIHDDVGQKSELFWAASLGRSGTYLHLSRIAGDGYRFRAKINWPSGNSVPNQPVLAARYVQTPQACTAGLRMWRKTSYRGHSGWAPAADLANHWPNLADGSTDFYHAANVHFIHEGNAGTATEHDLNTLVAAAEYQGIVQANVIAPYNTYTITFDMEHVWPFTTVKRLGIPRSGPCTNNPGQRALDRFRNSVVEPAITATWRRYREPLLHLLLQKIESSKGVLKGHYLVEFKSSGTVTINEYKCSAGCSITFAEVKNNCAAADLMTGANCPNNAACHGTMQLSRTLDWNSLPLPAVGISMGATWLFTSGGSAVWAHELGHHRHLEHAQSWPTSNTNAAPGAKVAQHDSEINPDPALVQVPGVTFDDGSSAVNKDRCWDRNCIMSYNNGRLYFCGKCILKNRGWAVEQLANPGGAVHD